MTHNEMTHNAQRITHNEINFDKADGLVPVIVQDHRSKEVLMVGYANREAVERTLATGRLHFWSRSRNALWLKGEPSGNFLEMRRLTVDCDGDALLAEVESATGETPVCHTGANTCFFQEVVGSASDHTEVQRPPETERTTNNQERTTNSEKRTPK
jgi:phosphoribosyl-ATP pyrophosphohydrolase/phosphoribosyl-AMP cyclohydrolase